MLSSHSPKILICAIVLCAAVFFSFFPCLKNDFTNWDDDTYLLDNSLVKTISPDGLRRIFSAPVLGSYLPLTILSFAVEYHFFRLDPKIYHFDNLILHTANSLLVFALIYLLSAHWPTALVTALLFGLNPLRVESVAWVTERKDVLFSFFFLASLLSYVLFILNSSRGCFRISCVLFFISVLAKPQGVALPFALLAVDYLYRRENIKNLVLEKIPFFLISIVFWKISFAASTPFLLENSFSGFDKLALTNYAVVLYLKKSLLPSGLCAFYPYPEKTGGHFPAAVYLSSVVILASAWIFLRRRCGRTEQCAALFFLITAALPLSNIWTGGHLLADRYAYLPSVGLFFLCALGFTHFLNSRPGNLKILFAIPLFVYLAAFSFLTSQRCRIWENSETLWSDVIQKYPRHYLAYLQRGDYSMKKGDYVSARQDLNLALSLNSRSAEALNTRGTLYYLQKEYPAALADLDTAIKIKPAYSRAYSNRGIVRMALGQYDSALADYDQAIVLDKYHLNPEPYHNRAVLYKKQGRYEPALQDYGRAIALDPDYAPAYSQRAAIYKILGNEENAVNDLRRAKALGFLK